MYIGQTRHDTQFMGAVPLVATAFNILGATSVIKNLFGIGKKKGALASIAANAQGKWTSQLPTYADWDEYLSRPATNPKAKAAGAKTFADEYKYWLGRKDSILIKNQIASAPDYGAYLIVTYGLKDGWIKPDAKPGSPFYNTGPFAIGTRIPIFDFEAITNWANSQIAAQTPAAPAPIPVQLTPQTVKPPTLSPLPKPTPLAPQIPQFTPQAAPQLQPTNLLAPSGFPDIFPQSAPQSAPPLAKADNSMLFLALAGGAAIYLATRKKGR